MDRKPRFAIAVTALFFVLLYLPIAAVVVFSFNSKKSLTVFDGWSLRWYRAFFHDDELTGSLGTSLKVAAVAMVGSVVIGARWPSGWSGRGTARRRGQLIMLIPLITPEIVTGVASLMLFKGVCLQPSLAHRDDRRDHVLDLLRDRDPAFPGRRAEPGDRGGRDGPRRHPVAGAAPGDLPALWPAILSARS